MIEFKQGDIAHLPVRLFAAGVPVNSVAYGLITLTVEKSNGTTASFNPADSEWTQIIAGAFNAQGKYTIEIPASLTDVSGILNYAVSDGSSTVYIGAVKVVEREEYESYDKVVVVDGKVDTIDTVVDGTATTVTTIDGKVDTIDTVVDGIASDVTLLKKYEEGRWKVHATGPDANRLVIYDTDGTTPILKFNLFNAAGDPSPVNPNERVKVP